MAQMTSYQKAAKRLRAKILKGTFPPGGRLPAERDLCGLLGISRITVRQALDLLEEEQLIVRRQGSGTYVSESPRQILPLSLDYAGSVRKHAPNLSRRLLGMRWTSAAPWASSFLGDVSGKILSAERLDKSRTENLAWDHAAIPVEFADKLTRKDLASLDFVNLWMQRQGITIFEIRQQVSAVAADQTDVERMGVLIGAPILQAIETYLSPSNKVLGVFLSHYLPGRIALHSRFRWSSQRTSRVSDPA